jgi:hypothetical protein
VGDDKVTETRGIFDTLMGDLRGHIKHEEEGDLPSLEGVLSSDETKRMADSFQRTKKFVPTRYFTSPTCEKGVGWIELIVGHILMRLINRRSRLLSG